MKFRWKAALHGKRALVFLVLLLTATGAFLFVYLSSEGECSATFDGKGTPLLTAVRSHGMTLEEHSVTEGADGTIVQQISYSLSAPRSRSVLIEASFEDGSSCDGVLETESDAVSRMLTLTFRAAFSQRILVSIRVKGIRSAGATCCMDYRRCIESIGAFLCGDGRIVNLYDACAETSPDAEYRLDAQFSKAYTVEAEEAVSVVEMTFRAARLPDGFSGGGWDEAALTELFDSAFSESGHQRPSLKRWMSDLTSVRSADLYRWYMTRAEIVFTFDFTVELNRNHRQFHLYDNVWVFEFATQYSQAELDEIFIPTQSVYADAETIRF